MANSYVQSVDISVNYNSADTASCYSELAQKVAEAICTIQGTVTILETATLSNDYPLYADTSSALLNTVYKTKIPQSNAYIVGLDVQNYCLGVCVSGDRLLLGLTPSLTKNDEIRDGFTQSTSQYCNSVMAYCMRYSSSASYPNFLNYCIPIYIDTTNAKINFKISYIKSSTGVAFKFSNGEGYSDYYNIVFVKNDNGLSVLVNSRSNSYGSNQLNPNIGLLAALNEPIKMTGAMFSSNSSNPLKAENILAANGYYEPYQFTNTVSFKSAYIGPNMLSRTLSLNFTYGFSNGYTTFNSSSSSSSSSSRTSISSSSSPSETLGGLNMPFLSGNQIFLRKQFQPLTSYRTELYMSYKLSTTEPISGAIYQLANGDKYVNITPAVIGVMMKLDN